MRKTLLALLLLTLPLGCSDEPAPEPSDGKYHPPPSGEHTTEKLACDALVDTHQKRLLEIGCVGTSRTCPEFLRTQFSGDCLEYDKGSVDGCLAYINEKTACADINAALDGCVITSYPDTAPAGCP